MTDKPTVSIATRRLLALLLALLMITLSAHAIIPATHVAQDFLIRTVIAPVEFNTSPLFATVQISNSPISSIIDQGYYQYFDINENAAALILTPYGESKTSPLFRLDTGDNGQQFLFCNTTGSFIPLMGNMPLPTPFLPPNQNNLHAPSPQEQSLQLAPFQPPPPQAIMYPLLQQLPSATLEAPEITPHTATFTPDRIEALYAQPIEQSPLQHTEQLPVILPLTLLPAPIKMLPPPIIDSKQEENVGKHDRQLIKDVETIKDSLDSITRKFEAYTSTSQTDSSQPIFSDNTHIISTAKALRETSSPISKNSSDSSHTDSVFYEDDTKVSASTISVPNELSNIKTKDSSIYTDSADSNFSQSTRVTQLQTRSTKLDKQRPSQKVKKKKSSKKRKKIEREEKQIVSSDNNSDTEIHSAPLPATLLIPTHYIQSHPKAASAAMILVAVMLLYAFDFIPAVDFSQLYEFFIGITIQLSEYITPEPFIITSTILLLTESFQQYQKSKSRAKSVKQKQKKWSRYKRIGLYSVLAISTAAYGKNQLALTPTTSSLPHTPNTDASFITQYGNLILPVLQPVDTATFKIHQTPASHQNFLMAVSHVKIKDLSHKEIAKLEKTLKYISKQTDKITALKACGIMPSNPEMHKKCLKQYRKSKNKSPADQDDHKKLKALSSLPDKGNKPHTISARRFVFENFNGDIIITYLPCCIQSYQCTIPDNYAETFYDAPINQKMDFKLHEKIHQAHLFETGESYTYNMERFSPVSKTWENIMRNIKVDADTMIHISNFPETGIYRLREKRSRKIRAISCVIKGEFNNHLY